MDNDIKIVNNETGIETHKEVLLFLNDELDKIQQTSQGKSYNLVEEYAKTKNHKSPFVWILLFCCFLSVGLIAFITNSVISRHNDEITVNLQEFDDLNLKTLLDSVSKVQTNYDEAVKKRGTVKGNLERALTQAENEYQNNIFITESMRIPSRDKEKKLSEYKDDYEKNVRRIHEEFDPILSEVEEEIKTYSAQLAEFDTAKVDSAREQQKAFDAERQVQEMEKKKIVDDYEGKLKDLNKNITDLRTKFDEDLRHSIKELNTQHQKELDTYDPVIKDGHADLIIASLKEETPEAFNSESYISETELDDEKVIAALEEFQAIYDDYSYLGSKTDGMPQKNTVVEYKKASASLVDKMGEVLISSAEGLIEDKDELKEVIEDCKNQIAERDAQIAKRETIIAQKDAEIAEKETKIQGMEAEAENKLAQEFEWFGDCLEGILTFANTNAIVLQVNDYDDTAVYIAKKARYLIPEGGSLGAEVRAQKVVKGRIYREVSEDEEDDEDYFYFVPDRDKNGNKIDINFSTFMPGTAIKLLSK